MYPELRPHLFKLIAYGGIKEGYINYDSDIKKVQVKDTKVNHAIMLEGIEFYNSTIVGDLKKCSLYNCNIKTSKLKECKLYNNNEIKRSKLLECNYNGNGITISSSYIENSPGKIIHADINSSMIRGKVSKLSNISDDCYPIKNN
jgi:uncharacterized LabA/DUF88 family protein